MSEALKFLDGLMGEALADLHTCMLGRIKSFDGKRMTADVTPLLKRKLNDGRTIDMPVISQAPVMFLHANGFFVRPPLKPGDLVVVVFAERELDAVLLSGSPQTPTSNRHHGLEDAIVLGGWLPFSGGLPVANDDDLIIGCTDGKVTITLTPDGTVEIVAPKGITLAADDITGTGVSIRGKNNSQSW